MAPDIHSGSSGTDKHMELALRADVAHCKKDRDKHVMGKAVRSRGRLTWIGDSMMIADVYRRQYESAVKRLDLWLARKGLW